MSYTPTEWETGDVVTAEKLNKLEGGVEKASKHVIPLITCNQRNHSSSSHTVCELYYAWNKVGSYPASGAPVRVSPTFDADGILTAYGDAENMYFGFPLLDIPNDNDPEERLNLCCSIEADYLVDISGDVVFLRQSDNAHYKYYRILGDFTFTMDYGDVI